MLWRVGAGVAAGGLLSSCAAAIALPIAAGSAIGMSSQHHQRHQQKEAAPVAAAAPADQHAVILATPSQRAAFEAGPTDVAAAGQPAVPPSMQYLYGSGEAAALSIQSYYQLANFAVAKASDRAVGHPVSSVVLAPGATLDDPKFMPCGDKPLAIVLDVDETTLLNYGFEADQTSHGGAYDAKRWADWERTGQSGVAPVPGVVDALRAARIAHVTVVFNSNRSTANAAGTAAAIDQAGLGPAVHGDTLWLAGDTPGGNGKDQRRWAISARYCVIAMAGDQLGDFSDLFNADGTAFAARRAMVANPHIAVLWGEGWFMLPNPVYGTALKGVFGEVFPLDKRWTDPADAGNAPAPQPAPATGSSN
ncbi:MAG: HAD family acid phosphatase [Sphingomonas sp.]